MVQASVDDLWSRCADQRHAGAKRIQLRPSTCFSIILAKAPQEALHRLQNVPAGAPSVTFVGEEPVQLQYKLVLRRVCCHGNDERQRRKPVACLERVSDVAHHTLIWHVCRMSDESSCPCDGELIHRKIAPTSAAQTTVEYAMR